MSINLHERIVQVRTLIVRKSTMIKSTTTISTSRAQATELVARAKRESGSLMIAYADVARTVGTSAGWIRKFIKGYEAKEPKASLYENIRENYEAFCDRVEQENEHDEKRLMSLRGKRDAGNQGFSAQGRTKNSNLVGGE
jgi:Mg-chelatase subunit ChlI